MRCVTSVISSTGSSSARTRFSSPAFSRAFTNSRKSRYATHSSKVFPETLTRPASQPSLPCPGPRQYNLSRPEAPMKTAFMLLLAILYVPAAFPQGAPPQGSADKPYVMEYYYKTAWGRQKEFLDLFLKNHFPLLQEIQKSGRILALKIETPANHMTEDSR